MGRNYSGILWGLVFIGVGAAMLLDRFNYLEFDLGNFLHNWWPAILIIIGIGMILDRSENRKGR